MMTKRSRKITAWFFLITLSVETFWPSVAWAVTSGPAQPEMQKFEPAGNPDLVDLFSGDMKYNIPLMDVGGYPLNLSYGSGTGMDEESSWVGAGWNLNPGAITRNMRGLPDDFNGNYIDNNNKGDNITKQYTRKEFKKVGGKIVIKPTVLGWEIGKLPSFKMGVYKDNYYGIGAEFGVSLGFNQAMGKRTALNAGLDLDSDTRGGVTLSPSLSLSVGRENQEESAIGSLSGSLAYNSRAGLKQASLSASFAPFRIQNKTPSIPLSATWYFGQTYTPTLNFNTVTHSEALSFDGGFTAWGFYIGLGGEGYVNKEKIEQKTNSSPAFGYLNYLDGRTKADVLLDYNREKDGTFIPGTPGIALPVPTQDYFMATSQGGSHQFRPFYGGNYIVYDKAFRNRTTNYKLGLTFGAGWIKKAGGRLDITDAIAETGKWTFGNGYLNLAEANFTNNPDEEKLFFKRSGEFTAGDESFQGQLNNNVTHQVALQRSNRVMVTGNQLKVRTNPGQSSPFVTGVAQRKTTREKRTSLLSYLTAREAKKYALDKDITSIDYNLATGVPIRQTIIREGGDKKANHISEMTVTDNDGKRLVYGIPVYNKVQKEVSFSVAAPDNSTAFEKARRTGQITYNPYIDNSLQNKKGREELFSSETTPPYATSWLLTGVLSPDYIDRTGDGITDDDYGTALKLNYKLVAGNYKWRAPYAANTANYNEGFLSDKKDDKASYSYGEKEIWYLSTMQGNKMAAVFYTSFREDGLGVNSENGGQYGLTRLHKLDSIQLFTDVEFAKPNKCDRIPIKTVHFEYDYSLNPNMPNNTGACDPRVQPQPQNCSDELLPVACNASDPNDNLNYKKGKLTLRKVYFTFGFNNRGKSNPYVFHYDMRQLQDMNITNLPAIPAGDDEATDNYLERQTDRWGTYKKSFFNRQKQGGNTRKLNNSEYPYTLQPDEQAGYDVKKLSDWFASHWQLNKIETPTGSVINIQYEADDYSFVQDRRAMRMMNVVGVRVGGNDYTSEITEGMINASGLIVELPKPVASVADFRDYYLRGADGQLLDKIFYRVNTDLDNNGHYEFVQGHAAIDPNAANYTLLPNSRVYIPLVQVKGASPMSFASWQMLKSDLPQFAYNNYDNSETTNFSDDFQAAVKAIVQSVENITELFQSFETTAKGKGFANKINLTKSFVRLYCHPEQSKLGGGARVKMVTMSDEWNVMTSNYEEKTVTGIVYDYTTKEGSKIISSGVASYEPQIGNEENPFREPVNYTEKVHWGTDRYHYIEKPFGETFFPAPQVGYSKVTVTAVGHNWIENGGDNPKHTGYIENEFYTSREFPTITDNLPLDNQKYENNMIARLFTCTAITRVANSQGFKIELNDMHGKSKSVAVFNKGGDKISSTEYFYKTKDENAAVKELDNTVPVLEEDGIIRNRTLGTDMEIATDVRQSNSQSIGTGIGTYAGFFIIPLTFITLYIPYGALNSAPSIAIENYNSIATTKVIHKYGIVYKVRTMKNGSVVEADNLVWDRETGSVLLSSSQNEFDDRLYTFNYPAYMAEMHDGMDGAYKNLGARVELTSNATTGVLSSAYLNILSAGDELVSVDGDLRGWIYKYNNDLMMMDKTGAIIKPNGQFMVIRSGKRNLTGLSGGTITMMKDPRKLNGGDTKIEITEEKRILDAKATVYKDEWPMPMANRFEIKRVVKPINRIECLQELVYGLVSYKIGSGLRGILNTTNVSVRDLHLIGHDPADFAKPMCASNKNYTDVIPTDLANTFYRLYQSRTDNNGNKTILAGDKASLGKFEIVFDYVSPAFIDLINTTVTQEQMRDRLNNYNGGGQGYEFIVVREETENDVSQNLPWAPGPYALLSRPIPNCTGSPNDWSNNIAPCLTRKYFTFHLEAHNDLLMDLEVCSPPSEFNLNPYFEGISGNWRPLHNYEYSTDRVQSKGLPYLQGGTDIRNSGYYSSYDPFWLFSGQKLTTTVPATINNANQKWIWGDQAIYFDKRSNEIESAAHRITNGEPVEPSDPDRVYAAALFGFNDMMMLSKAVNARRNEIAYDGFEDYSKSARPQGDPCPVLRHLDFGITSSNNITCNGNFCVSSEKSHTGKYSLRLITPNSPISIGKQAGKSMPATSFLAKNASGVKITDNELGLGFAPIPGKKYIFSCWVNDNQPNTANIKNFNLNINGTQYLPKAPPDPEPNFPVVEGWKRLEVEFMAGQQFTLNFSGTAGDIYVDDIRILPVDGQMTSYVYNDNNYRLMAQLDENNFATFYEYDSEGTLIRLKKETERGIMTIKENRQFIKKKSAQ